MFQLWQKWDIQIDSHSQANLTFLHNFANENGKYLSFFKFYSNFNWSLSVFVNYSTNFFSIIPSVCSKNILSRDSPILSTPAKRWPWLSRKIQHAFDAPTNRMYSRAKTHICEKFLTSQPTTGYNYRSSSSVWHECETRSLPPFPMFWASTYYRRFEAVSTGLILLPPQATSSCHHCGPYCTGDDIKFTDKRRVALDRSSSEFSSVFHRFSWPPEKMKAEVAETQIIWHHFFIYR